MKDVTDVLSEYLNTSRHLSSCDLCRLTLASGKSYLFTDADKNVTYDGNVYQHNILLIKRQQVKINDRVVVDTMNVTIYLNIKDKLDGVPIMTMAHSGAFDRATLHLIRAFFEGGEVIGTIGLFGGFVEVKKCGGLQLDLTVKAKTQGLSQEYPRRKYYPQGAYTTANGTVAATGTNDGSCLITPFVPLKEVLL